MYLVKREKEKENTRSREQWLLQGEKSPFTDYILSLKSQMMSQRGSIGYEMFALYKTNPSSIPAAIGSPEHHQGSLLSTFRS